MNAPLVKICGLRDAATAAAAARLAADWFGFVFAPSRRRVAPRDARAMIDAVREAGGHQKFAGVFVNPSLEELSDTLAEAPLDAVQLHGTETPEFIRAFRAAHPGVAVWKALGVGGEEHGHAADRLAPYAGLLDALLLDTHDLHVGGGTGRTFRWEAIPPYAEWAADEAIPLFVAGGLHAGNVGDLVESYRPGGVDVSSGVETDGVKDLQKIRDFVRKVKTS